MKFPTVAITGLSATDNPAPGVPVARAVREGSGGRSRIVGLSYDVLDPGNYMDGIADAVFLMPYPSSGAEVVFDRLREIHEKCPIDVIIPTLDAEIALYIKIADRLRDLGVHMFLPREEQLKLRSKARFSGLKTELGINVPESIAISDSGAIPKLDKQLKFPVMVKGQFYDAHIAYSPMEVERHFQSLRQKWGVPVIVQEFIAGEEYDVVALGDGKGQLISAVPMRKMQLTEKGKAWGGITINDPVLMDFVEETVQKLKWRGPSEFEVMRSRDTKELYLLEINPRFPAWVYLAVGAGRNLPWMTVNLALQKPVASTEAPEPGIMFLRHSFDQICALSDYEALTTKGELVRTGEETHGKTSL